MMGWIKRNRMKIARYFVGFLFLWNIGILQSMVEDAKKGELPGAVKTDRMRILQNFIHVRQSAAVYKQMNGIPYTPDNYFMDMNDIFGIQKTLGVSVSIHESMSSLREIMQRGLGKQFFQKDLIEARAKYSEVEKAEANQYEEVRGKVKQFTWTGFFLFFFWLYFKNYLPVFLLYLIWMRENKDNEHGRSFPNPLHFLWRIVAHPYYLSRVFWKWFVTRGREFVYEAELRRTKENLFVYLTEREERRIKNFAKNGLPIQVWRDLLTLRGLRPVHSLAAALAVTLIFTLLPRPVEAKSKPMKQFDPVSVSWQVFSYHLPRMAIDDGQTDLKIPGVICGEKAFRKEPLDSPYFPDVSRLTILRTIFRFQEVWREIVHIPLSRLFSSVSCFFQTCGD
jgi:hypothetical protein